MVSKLKHIASKFWVHSIISTLLIVILMAFAIIASIRKDSILAIAKINSKTTSNVELIQNNFEKALLLQKSDPDFVSVTCDKLIQEQKQLLKNISDSIEKISAVKFFKKPLKKSGVVDTLNKVFDSYSITFEKTLLSLKEIGNPNQGLAAEVIIPLNNLSEPLSRNPLLVQESYNLIKKTTSFLQSLSSEDLLELVQFCQDLNNQLEIKGIDPLKYEIQINDFQNKLSDLLVVQNRLYDPQTLKGQFIDLKLYNIQISNHFQHFSDILNHEIDTLNFYWNLWIIILTILLIGINLYFLNNFSRKSTIYFKSLLNSTSQLSKGHLDVELSENSAYEFNDLNHNLSTLNTQLVTKKNFVDNLLLKQFEQNLVLLSDKDELGTKLIALKEQMLKAQNEQEIYDKQSERRRYINEGLAKFGDIMRQNSNNTVALGDNLIKALVKYINALQGSIFLSDEDDDSKLNLIAAFAFDRKKYLTKTIQKGEGLVGTCAIEKSTINLTEVPEEYIIIKSGLGDTPPRNILIIPVMHEYKLVGVIELASLKILSDYEIELAEEISANLASTIITVRNNTKTAQLLEKSQQQAAEMAEQEEEMRQNMEELKATQEESARKEEEMLGIIEAIGTSFYVIEYNTDGTISHINERLARFLDQPYDSIINRKHKDVFSSQSLISPELFTDLINNQKSKNISETLNWGSRVFHYKHSLSLVLSKYGEVLKIMNLLSIDEKKSEN